MPRIEPAPVLFALLASSLVASLISGCVGRIEGPKNAPDDQRPGGGGPGGDPHDDPRDPTDPPPEQSAFLAAGIRRLTDREVLTELALLFPAADLSAQGLPSDARQSDFTRNRAQIVDPVFVRSIRDLAESVAAEMLASHRAALAPCVAESALSDTCARDTLSDLASRAFRRAPAAAEVDALLTVYGVGRTEKDGWYGLRLGIEAILQSPSFLYVRELGAPIEDGRVRLDGRELAESISSLFTGHAADSALLAAADAGRLSDPAERERQARRLYAAPETKRHLAEAILEWLRVDRLNETAKDANTYPTFFNLRSAMWDEALAFSTASLEEGVNTLNHLLTASESRISRPLAEHYGVSGEGKVDLLSAGRRGILSQAAFLATFAAPTESSPVRRGNAILKKLLCVELTIPPELRVNIVPPAPDPGLTTRERYSQHSRDPACAQCHQLIDPLGFVFERFDGIGRSRTTENGKPISTAVEAAVGDIRGPLPDHLALIEQLAAASAVEECFARNMVRFAAGQRAQRFEDGIITEWKAARPSSGGGLLDILVSYVKSESFAVREAS